MSRTDASPGDGRGSPREGGSPRTWLLLLVALLVVLGLGSAASQLFYGGGALSVQVFRGGTMGTTWTVKAVLPQGTGGAYLDAVADTIASRLGEIERLMSTWDPASEVSLFNDHGGTEAFPLSSHTLEVLRVAREVSEASDGALDVTIAPLVDAWSFGPRSADEPPGAAPDSALIARLRERVGYRKLLADAAAGTVAKAEPEMTIDLSAVAKGYAVDRVSDGLVTLGVTAFAVEVGGEVRARGAKADGSAWTVAVESPEADVRRVVRTIPLRDEAIATSGDYRNFFEVEGVRYAHIIDPRTGRPVPLRGFGVSVIHPTAALADAWATAMGVLGPAEGLRMADREGIAALFVVLENGEPSELPSRAMQDRLSR